MSGAKPPPKCRSSAEYPEHSETEVLDTLHHPLEIPCHQFIRFYRRKTFMIMILISSKKVRIKEKDMTKSVRSLYYGRCAIIA